MKTKTRMQMADGFALIGTIGMLATAFLVPDQWLSGQVRVEAQIGSLVSLLCVILAALAARSVIFGLKVLFSTLLVASLGYLAVVLFAASGAGWNGRVAVLVGGLSLSRQQQGWCCGVCGAQPPNNAFKLRVNVVSATTEEASFYPVFNPLSYSVENDHLIIGRNEVCDAYLRLRGALGDETIRGEYFGFGWGHKPLGFFVLGKRR